MSESFLLQHPARPPHRVPLKPGSGPMAETHERTELRAWRLFGGELMPLLEEAIAAQGERPDPRTLKLQHALAELLAANSHPNSTHIEK